MRSVLIGLVGVVLAATLAHAGACRLDGLEVVAEARGSNADPNLVGAHFRVAKQASEFTKRRDEVKGLVTAGLIKVELVGDKGRFIVIQDYEPSASPWVSASSRGDDEPVGRPVWGNRDLREEQKLFELSAVFDVYTGPLAGLTLTPTNCR